METDLAQNPEPLFRPVKRRKFLRKRVDDEPDQVAAENSSHPPRALGEDGETTREIAPFASPKDQDENGESQIADIRRLRKPYKARRGGIEFSTSSRQRPDDDSQYSDVVAAPDPESEKIRAICDRFTTHTGQKVDVDKHMMAYIESEMAKRHHGTAATEAPASDTPKAGEGEPSNRQSDPRLLQREPASLGKLHEIDLGQEAKLQNIARTEAATRRLAGDQTASPEEESPKKARSGKDGKPWRNRRRRNSEDIERDKLVEEVLRESKLDVYDEPEQEEQQDDQAADDRIAEQFRRDFLDALQSRRRGTRTRNTKAAKSDAPRGPKLGGSRSARAAMREKQEKAGQK
ncbi:hypothetical protein VTN00DRAFT_4602 [Thermoascus crustaceus]|uniref:uncharacterized protein n=1 Tax=Thermoascus crustaceus TaxID=5088 RepID=UPI0037431488